MSKQVYNNEQLIKLFLDQDYSNGPITGRTPNKKYYVDDGRLYLASDGFILAQFAPDGSLGIAVHPTDEHAGNFTCLLSICTARRLHIPVTTLN